MTARALALTAETNVASTKHGAELWYLVISTRLLQLDQADLEG